MRLTRAQTTSTSTFELRTAAEISPVGRSAKRVRCSVEGDRAGTHGRAIGRRERGRRCRFARRGLFVCETRRALPASRKEIELLYGERYAGFRRALAAVTGSYESAHDVVQEAFARALAERQRYRGDGPLGAWVWGIALRVAREERRRGARLHFVELPDARIG